MTSLRTKYAARFEEAFLEQGERGSLRVGIFYGERFTFYGIFPRENQRMFPHRGQSRAETREGNLWFVR